MLGGVSYGRCDFRIDGRTGQPFFLEINPNCGIFYPPGYEGTADFILETDPMGHEGFIDTVIAAAMARHDPSDRRCQVRHDPRGGGYHLVAARALKAGELVLEHEERPHFLVSQHHIETRWSPEQQDVMSRYGYPVGPGLWVMWSDDPLAWRPINHSCDPNAWLDEDSGLNVHARRDIARGEEICMDYSTFAGPKMAPFECHCGAPDCRGLIEGVDEYAPWLLQRYGTRISAFVRDAQDALTPRP